jgi:hypothetical protein
VAFKSLPNQMLYGIDGTPRREVIGKRNAEALLQQGTVERET